MKYHIAPFGCQMNKSDAERLCSVLDRMGCEETDDDEDGDIMGVIACSVRQKAIDRVYGKIQKWNRIKAKKPLITFLTGCVLPADRDKFLKLFDLVFPIDQLTQLPDMIRQYGVPTAASLEDETAPVSSAAAPYPERIKSFWQVKPRYSSSVQAYVPIQNGCNKFCSFCAVPYTRGREISRPPEEVLDEVRRLVESGCKAITLLGQNVNSYGLDMKGGGTGFPELMQAVGEIGREMEREFWVFFTAPHPRDINRELLEVMADHPVLAKWIHLPLQSGDNSILLRMNRNYSMERYRAAVADIRRILPVATLFTDIIVGFSGENEDHFQATADSMREFKFDMAYIAQYSPRPGARSARWADDVPREEKERRYHVLSTLLNSEAAPSNRARIGGVERVLVVSECRKKGFLSGFTQGRIPVRVKAEGVRIGDFVDVRITAAQPLSIEGTPVSRKAVIGESHR